MDVNIKGPCFSVIKGAPSPRALVFLLLNMQKLHYQKQKGHIFLLHESVQTEASNNPQLTNCFWTSLLITFISSGFKKPKKTGRKSPSTDILIKNCKLKLNNNLQISLSSCLLKESAFLQEKPQLSYFKLSEDERFVLFWGQFFNEV